jgi:hypothetical protein
MPKRKPRPVTVSTPQKGRSKLKGGIPLDELLAAHAPCPRDEKDPGSGAGSGQSAESEAKERPRTAFAAPG